mmetsp:Transcript_26619/g.36749  ORF Transcript_26619/g.36749 Transcript_26619/m.36749 type:complete len:177 (+) Transcript_26619:36-566(+)|eukprot:CAMPEP_0196589216 /NCGR_PEP_ID=MMETSP1081-20130531/63021_1 /TAXON_ID=36882 /ORGANISM="Pyramimonas amylifera, Strain CCMP720" /LENGTH=176 /DNA_ID=CAMNT_0041911953 /DNA_START=36 /DNA_END=566 /DNA_ORIENTATION=-
MELFVSQFESHPDRNLNVFCFKNVKNGGDLHKRIIAGELGIEAAFIDAALLPEIFPVILAANKTLISESLESLTTRSLHSELVYNLSGSKHISLALKKWGVSDTCTKLVVAKFDATSAEVSLIRSLVEGEEVGVEELGELYDLAAVKKNYKILDTELKVGSLTDAIITRIAARECM